MSPIDDRRDAVLVAVALIALAALVYEGARVAFEVPPLALGEWRPAGASLALAVSTLRAARSR